MTLHWWMHWFWITLIHSLVTLPLLLPGTLSAPSQDRLHGIQSPISTPPVPIGVGSWVPKSEISGGKEGTVVTEAAASDGGHLSPPLLQNDQGGLANVSPVTAVEESGSKADAEATSFLEKEDERSWGLEDPAPRPPFFLQSGLDLEEEDEDESIHLSAGMPWPPASVPRVEISSPSVRPTIIPSHESPSSTVEPWPANKTLDQSSAGESQPDVSEGGESAGRGPREQPQEPNPQPSLNSSSLPEAIVSSETLTSPSSVWTQYSSSMPSSYIDHTSPLYFEVFSSTQPYSDSFPSSTLSDIYPSLSPTYFDSSSSPLHTGESSPSISQISQAVISDIPPTLSSLLIPSDTLSSDAVHSREGKAIGVSHVDQQPKQEQKQIEVVDGSEDTPSTTAATSTTTTTVSPTTVNVESSPVKSSSNSNSTADVVGREDKDVKNENVTTDSSGPVKDASNSDSSEKVVEVDKAEDEHLTPVVDKEAKVDDKKDIVSGRNETGSINVDSSVVDKDSSNVGKPTKEEDIAPPVEVPTPVAVREGSASIHSDLKKDQDGGVQASEKDSILAAADVPSSVHQGRMTAPRSLDTASIVGISLGSVLLVGAVAGGVGFVLYRRSLYANKPQTLNDKCSNPDSSGYIDDTLRENSEEMYSLDNDSFLNSLEAMTIQNYWTDSVKHTKL
ncbi:hypothetical protein J437_LFUL005626 [Ladona fulva]|uniref:Flocculation protein FLO11-like n=1 Tax=Ladona fulva TaxID=123851 RepID=A0A8K0K075_LADFU|nr:hypothetical protein J437_LFUL005626 [Ladona fulva]